MCSGCGIDGRKPETTPMFDAIVKIDDIDGRLKEYGEMISKRPVMADTPAWQNRVNVLLDERLVQMGIRDAG
jgi:ABC-type hemin transport system substrate-binding protein